MRRQGQYAIIEHIILLGAGVAITLGFLAAFQTMNDDITHASAMSESRLVAQFVAANTASLAQSGSSGRITLDIPATIAGNEYAIKLRDGGVEVVTGGAEYTAPLYGLSGRVDVSGHVISREEQVSIVYTDDSMQITEEQ